MPLHPCPADAAAPVSSTPHPFTLHLRTPQVVSLLDGPRTVLSSKAWVNVDPQAQKVGRARVNVRIRVRVKVKTRWAPRPG